MEGRVVLDEGAVHNRTTYVVDESPENDPLHIPVPAEQPKEEEVPVPEEKPPVPDEKSQGDEAEQVQEDAPVEINEAHFTDLDNIFKAKAGVDFNTAVSILAELARWKLDIEAAMAMQQTQPQVPQQPPAPAVPQYQRSQGRQTASPGADTYKFRRSEILAMSQGEYDKRAQEITQAYINGQVLNDIR